MAGMRSAALAAGLVAILVLPLLPPAEASAFLRHSQLTAALAAQEGTGKQRAILAELEDALGSEHRQATEARLSQIEEALRPTFAALPKGADGTVHAPAARYALHRLFVSRHGWQVKGLEPSGQLWAAAVGERAPGSVRDLFEERLGGRGLDLHELAVLASTLENLIHGEVVDRLRLAYELRLHSTEEALSAQDEALQVLDTYMAVYVSGANVTELPKDLLRQQMDTVSQWYPTWPQTQRFLQEVQHEVMPSVDTMTFANVTAVVEEVSERFGQFQNTECRTLKGDLIALETFPGSGRVRLADFYASALDEGKWQFSESADYLLELGALDWSDPTSMQVLVPNYLASPSNCIASSAYYGVCCIDECEAILGHLERHLGAPTARPAEITALVASLPSPPRLANGSLPAALAGRLEEVAAHHGGRVPLHGRLFAQWLHHAYPRECPFPHTSGTKRPKTAEEEWKKAGRETSASVEEMEEYIAAGRAGAPSGPASEGELCSPMWLKEEELVDERAHRAEASRASTKTAGSPAPDTTPWSAIPLLAALIFLAWTVRSALVQPATLPH